VFASLRGGTVNTIARNFGVRGRPDRLLARLLSAARKNTLRAVEHDLLEVEGRFGFLFASLMGARFLKAFYARERRTVASAARLTMHTMASSLTNGKLARSLFSTSRVELIVDDEPPRSEQYRLLVASTVRDVGFGFRVPYDAGKKRGHFHVVASGLSTTKMALQLPRVLSGRPLDGAPHLDRLVRRLRVRFAAEESYTLDGDLFAARELTLRAGPRLPIAVL
jgi:diacylglycerol kinase family enzyme